jgi:hypothetical protein
MSACPYSSSSMQKAYFYAALYRPNYLTEGTICGEKDT